MSVPHGAHPYLSRRFTLLFLLSLLLLLMPSRVNAESVDLGGSTGGNVTIDPSIPPEVLTVLQDVEQSILGNFTRSIKLGSGACQPQLSLGFFSFKLTLTQSATCHLDGTITLNWFPLSANVDLNVVGMPHVQAINFNANILLQPGSGGFTIGFQWLDGEIAMDLGPGASNQIWVLNGRVGLTIGQNGSFQSRENVFDSVSLAGLALVTDVTKAPPSASMQGCQLAGGDPNNVMAGTLSACTQFVKQ